MLVVVVVVSKGSGDGVCVCGRAKCSQADACGESGAGSVRKRLKSLVVMYGNGGCQVF